MYIRNWAIKCVLNSNIVSYISHLYIMYKCIFFSNSYFMFNLICFTKYFVFLSLIKIVLKGQ